MLANKGIKNNIIVPAYIYFNHVFLSLLCMMRRLGSVTLDCRPRDCKFDPPLYQLKLLKEEDMYWFFRGKSSFVLVLITLGMRTWFVLGLLHSL